jgi:hypothetical protein
MREQPTLSEAEWALIVELLHQEQADLPVEIHHTRSNDVRADLCQRRDIVRGLLERLQTPTIA